MIETKETPNPPRTFYGNVFHERTTSGFSLSVSTGIAMEALFTPREPVTKEDYVPPKRVDVSHYQVAWINVLTLIRNIFGALPKEPMQYANPDMLAEVVHQEIDVIRSLFRIEGADMCKPYFYFAEYHGLMDDYKDVFRLKQESSPTAQHARWMYDQARHRVRQEDPSIVIFPKEIRLATRESGLILTHLPVDLLSHDSFRTLELLESHTGKIKTQLEWNTKYSSLSDPNMRRLPFNRLLLYIFGDNSHIQPTSIKVRRLVLEIAEKQRWNPTTSSSRVVMDIERYFEDTSFVRMCKRVPT